MSKLIYYRTLLLGAVIGIVFVSFFYVFTHDDEPNKQPITPKSNFEVIDHYKDCDLVRWSDRGLSEYKYVLYCPK